MGPYRDGAVAAASDGADGLVGHTGGRRDARATAFSNLQTVVKRLAQRGRGWRRKRQPPANDSSFSQFVGRPYYFGIRPRSCRFQRTLQPRHEGRATRRPISLNSSLISSIEKASRAFLTFSCKHLSLVRSYLPSAASRCHEHPPRQSIRLQPCIVDV